MTIAIIQSAWTLFQNTEMQDFTGKMIKGIAIFQLLKPEDYEKADIERIRWLRDCTHEDIMTSVYELDRMVDPTRGERLNTQFTLDNGQTYTQDRIQYFLCRAIEETHEIIYRTLKKYKMEIPLDVDRDTGQKADDW